MAEKSCSKDEICTKSTLDVLCPAKKLKMQFRLQENFLSKIFQLHFTHLGENISSLTEAEANTEHYLDLLDKINKEKLDIEISLKLTHIGLDLSFEKTLKLFSSIASKAKSMDNYVFIDIEDSSYADKTIDFYKKIKVKHQNVGLCLQAYLYRTMDDIKGMIDLNPCIRLVKGAYKESSSVAFPKLSQVNDNFVLLSNYLLEQIKEKDIRVAFGTHDLLIQEQVKKVAFKLRLPNERFEFQMLYGIKNSEQYKLASEGYKIRTLISYGEHWYPWYMRRLAERPANVGFVLKNILSN